MLSFSRRSRLFLPGLQLDRTPGSADARPVPSAAREHMEISFPLSGKEAFKSALFPTVGRQLSAQAVGRWRTIKGYFARNDDAEHS